MTISPLRSARRATASPRTRRASGSEPSPDCSASAACWTGRWRSCRTASGSGWLRDLALGGYGFEVTVRIGEQQLSLVVPRAQAAGLRPDDPVRLTVRPESLLLFEADGPRRPGRRISA